ncbi:hypothetical protein [Oleiharenicola sp. Vm1]|uniref:hypothetical protein n=1 Tax=Oleiharenicola sp. Vm1 TaxID=3398393 RepID=UPI0039F57E3E
MPSSWPGTTWFTIIGQSALIDSCVVAPPALLMTTWCVISSSGMRSVQPSTSLCAGALRTSCASCCCRTVSRPTVKVMCQSDHRVRTRAVSRARVRPELIM